MENQINVAINAIRLLRSSVSSVFEVSRSDTSSRTMLKSYSSSQLCRQKTAITRTNPLFCLSFRKLSVVSTTTSRVWSHPSTFSMFHLDHSLWETLRCSTTKLILTDKMLIVSLLTATNGTRRLIFTQHSLTQCCLTTRSNDRFFRALTRDAL